jgi:hypothetical protein
MVNFFEDMYKLLLVKPNNVSHISRSWILRMGTVWSSKVVFGAFISVCDADGNAANYLVVYSSFLPTN